MWCPTGSIVVALLFLICINDHQFVFDVLDSAIFTDDTSLFYSHKDISALFLKVNNRLVFSRFLGLRGKLGNAEEKPFIPFSFRPIDWRRNPSVLVKVNNDLHKINQWFISNKVLSNKLKKMKYTIFQKRNKKDDISLSLPKLKINSYEIKLPDWISWCSVKWKFKLQIAYEIYRK